MMSPLRFRKRFLLLFLFGFLTSQTSAFGFTYPIHTFVDEQAPRLSGITGLYQDARGFIWATGNNGAGWYDGQVWHVYRREDGLPDDYCQQLTNGPDGKVYLSTNSGIGIVNVKTGEVASSPALQGRSIWDILFHHGDLIAATRDGLVLVRGLGEYSIALKDTTGSGPFEPWVYTLTFDPARNVLWALTVDQGVYTVDLDALEPLFHLKDKGLDEEYIDLGRARFEELHPGVLDDPATWRVSDPAERMRLVRSAVTSREPATPASKPRWGGFGAYRGLNDTLFVRSRAGTFWYNDQDSLFYPDSRVFKHMKSFYRMDVDTTGRWTWGGTEGWLTIQGDDSLHLSDANGLPRSMILYWLRTSDAIWLVDANQVIHRVSSTALKIFSHQQYPFMSTMEFEAIGGEDGDVYLADAEQVTRYRDGTLTPINVVDKDSVMIEGLATDRNNRLLLFMTNQIWFYDPVSKQQRVVLPPSHHHISNGVMISKDEAGTLWFEFAGVLRSWDGTRLRTVLDAPEHVSRVKMVYADSLGRVWFSSRDRDGIYLYDHGRLTRYTTNEIREWPSILERPEDSRVRKRFDPPLSDTEFSGRGASTGLDGAVWVGTFGAGILRIDGDSVRVFNTSNGLDGNSYYLPESDDAGNLYFVGRGIAKVSRHGVAMLSSSLVDLSEARGLQQDKQGRIYIPLPQGLLVRNGEHEFLLDRTFGLTESSCWDATPLGNGEILVPQNSDFFVFHPDKLFEKAEVQRRPVITSVYSGNQSLVYSDRIVLPRGQRDLTLQFALADDFNPSRNRFSWKLGGIDTSFTEPSYEQTTEYPRLPPGHYKFYLHAWNGAGYDTELDHPVEVVIPAYFYETAWFRAFLLLALLSGLVVIIRWRDRQAEERQHRLEQIIEQRTLEILEQERKATDAQVESERLRVVQQLAGTLAHELNNPLAVLKMIFELNADRMMQNSDPTFQRQVELIPRSIDRMSRVVQRLLNITDIRERDYADGMKILRLLDEADLRTPREDTNSGQRPEGSENDPAVDR